jgi:DnaJ-class molecular chaperone
MKENGVPSSKIAKDLFKAGFRAMAKKHHPDNGGDNVVMGELNDLKQALNI